MKLFYAPVCKHCGCEGCYDDCQIYPEPPPDMSTGPVYAIDKDAPIDNLQYALTDAQQRIRDLQEALVEAAGCYEPYSEKTEALYQEALRRK